jgi:peptide/nickel transport system substrate-binding protein
MSPTIMTYRTPDGLCHYALYEGLVMIDPQGEAIPSLATSWTISEDATEWIFTLREGVEFHDGTPWNAEACAKNFEYYNATLGRGHKTDIESWEVLDTYEIKIVYSVPKPWALHDWGWMSGMVSPTQFDALGEMGFGQDPIGTGPFKFVEWDIGSRIVFERNEDYWGDRAYLDGIEMRIMPERTTMLLEYEAGNLDILNMAELPAHVARLNATGMYEIQIAGTGSHQRVVWDNQEAPWNDLKVRQAMNYAVNRDAIKAAIYYGLGAPARGPIRYGFEPYYSLQEFPYSYDPDMATDLLDQAGLTEDQDGWRIRGVQLLCSPDYSLQVEIATIVQDNLRDVGIEVVLDPQERGIYMQRAYVQMDFELLIAGWGGMGDYPYGWVYHLHSKHIPTGGLMDWNYFKLIDAEMDALNEELEFTSTAMDPDRVLELIDLIAENYNENAWTAPLIDPFVVHANQLWVEGYNTHPEHPKPIIITNTALGWNIWLSESS